MQVAPTHYPRAWLLSVVLNAEVAVDLNFPAAPRTTQGIIIIYELL